MHIDVSKEELTMLILSVDTTVDGFSKAGLSSESPVEAKRWLHRLESVMELKEKLLRRLQLVQ